MPFISWRESGLFSDLAIVKCSVMNIGVQRAGYSLSIHTLWYVHTLSHTYYIMQQVCYAYNTHVCCTHSTWSLQFHGAPPHRRVTKSGAPQAVGNGSTNTGNVTLPGLLIQVVCKGDCKGSEVVSCGIRSWTPKHGCNQLQGTCLNLNICASSAAQDFFCCCFGIVLFYFWGETKSFNMGEKPKL